MSAEPADAFFSLQRCRSCANAQHYDRPRCLACGSADLALEGPSGRGTIYSFTLVQRSPLPQLGPPFVLALVRLEEGPIVMSHIVGADADALACEMPVTASWKTFDDGTRLAVFHLDDGQDVNAAAAR